MAFFSELKDKSKKRNNNSNNGYTGKGFSKKWKKDDRKEKSFAKSEYKPKDRKFGKKSSNQGRNKKQFNNRFDSANVVNNEKKSSYLDYEYENIKHQPQEEQLDENLLVGRNPIREAIKTGRDIEKLYVLKGELSGSAREIVAKARENKIVIQEVDKRRLDAMSKNHQGMIAIASAYQYHDVQDILDIAKEKGEAPFIVILDGVTDPHNLGAIIRSAECAGAHGVIVPARRSAGLSASAVKASAGAVEHIMVAKVSNLANTVDLLKKNGIWIYAADMQGEDYRSIDYKGGVALIVGSEGEGVSQLLLEKSDKVVSIGLKGHIESLNVSVATGILLFEIVKNR